MGRSSKGKGWLRVRLILDPVVDIERSARADPGERLDRVRVRSWVSLDVVGVSHQMLTMANARSVPASSLSA